MAAAVGLGGALAQLPRTRPAALAAASLATAAVSLAGVSPLAAGVSPPLAADVSLLAADLSPPSSVQEDLTLRGVVVAAATGEPVAGAEVLIRGTPLRVRTGADGGFAVVLSANRESYTVVVAAAGFRTTERTVEPGAGQGRGGAVEGAGALLRIELARVLIEVPGLTVAASRGAARPGEAPTSVAVVSGEDLRRRNVTNLAEALPFAQGVTFVAGQIDIRGAQGMARGVGSRVLMLLDGHRFLTGTGSSVDFGAMPLLDVERVEVVKGPHSTLWGTNALGGVVNVVTRRPPGGRRTVVRGYYGVFDTPGKMDFTEDVLSMEGIQLQHTRRIRGADLTLFGGREGSDGFRQNGGVDRWRFRAKAVFGPESANPWEVFANWKREDAEEFFTWRSAARPLEVDPTQLGDWKRETNVVVGMTAVPVANSTVRVQARPQIYHTRAQNFFHDNDDFNRSTRWGADVQVTVYSDGAHAVTTGAEAAYTQVSSSFLAPDPTVTDLAIFAQDEVAVSDRLRGTAGVRVDHHRASPVERELAINPKLGLVYQPRDRVSLRASLSRGYRVPSISEQFSSTTVFGFRVVPNLELRGESAWAGEVGATATPWDRVWFDAGLFWSEYQDLIEVAAAPGEVFTFQFRNVAAARVRGLDAGVRVGLWPERLNLHTNYLLLDSEDERTDRPLPYRSRHNVTSTLSAWGDRIALDMRHRSRAEEVLAFPLDDRGSITVLDLRMETVVRDVEVQAKVGNILQAEYVDVQERNPGPTRSFRVTLTSRF